MRCVSVSRTKDIAPGLRQRLCNFAARHCGLVATSFPGRRDILFSLQMTDMVCMGCSRARNQQVLQRCFRRLPKTREFLAGWARSRFPLSPVRRSRRAHDQPTLMFRHAITLNGGPFSGEQQSGEQGSSVAGIVLRAVERLLSTGYASWANTFAGHCFFNLRKPHMRVKTPNSQSRSRNLQVEVHN
jgi:hypothetical protein